MELAQRGARMLPRGTIVGQFTQMADTLRSYGVKEQEAAANDVAAHAERIRLAGYSVLAGGFSAREIGGLSARLDEVLRRQTEQFGGDRLERIGDEFTARC